MAKFPFPSRPDGPRSSGAAGRWRGPARVGDRAPEIALPDVEGYRWVLHDGSSVPTVVIFHRHIH